MQIKFYLVLWKSLGWQDIKRRLFVIPFWNNTNKFKFPILCILKLVNRIGWNDYVMRIFTLQQGGFTPEHSHPWPHINYVIEGKGTLYLDGVHYTVEDGFVAYIPPNSIHQFKNTEDREFKFICIVPKGCDK